MSLPGTNPILATVVPLTTADTGLADAGIFYTAIEATPGVTGIIGPVSTALDDTKALMSVYNGGAMTIFPKFLRLHVYTIGTTGTRVHFTQAIDTAPNRYSSGGSALVVANTNMTQPTNAALAQIQFGALTLTAASGSRRYIHNTTYKATAIETAEDCYQFSWGGSTQLEDPASLSNVAAALSNVAFNFAPVAIGPQQSFLIHQWRASITVGITFGVEFGFTAK